MVAMAFISARPVPAPAIITPTMATASELAAAGHGHEAHADDHTYQGGAHGGGTVALAEDELSRSVHEHDKGGEESRDHRLGEEDAELLV